MKIEYVLDGNQTQAGPSAPLSTEQNWPARRLILILPYFTVPAKSTTTTKNLNAMTNHINADI